MTPHASTSLRPVITDAPCFSRLRGERFVRFIDQAGRLGWGDFAEFAGAGRIATWALVAHGPWLDHDSGTTRPVLPGTVVEVLLAGDDPGWTHVEPAESFTWRPLDDFLDTDFPEGLDRTTHPDGIGFVIAYRVLSPADALAPTTQSGPDAAVCKRSRIAPCGRRARGSASAPRRTVVPMLTCFAMGQ